MSLTTASFWSATELSCLMWASSLRPRRAWTSRLCLSNISSACNRCSSCWRTSNDLGAGDWSAAVPCVCVLAAFCSRAAWSRQDSSRWRSSRSDGEYVVYHGTADDAVTQIIYGLGKSAALTSSGKLLVPYACWELIPVSCMQIT